jgi:hypothetical protein
LVAGSAKAGNYDGYEFEMNTMQVGALCNVQEEY